MLPPPLVLEPALPVLLPCLPDEEDEDEDEDDDEEEEGPFVAGWPTLAVTVPPAESLPPLVVLPPALLAPPLPPPALGPDPLLPVWLLPPELSVTLLVVVLPCPLLMLLCVPVEGKGE